MYYATHKVPTDNLIKLEKQVKSLNAKIKSARVTAGSLKISPMHEVIEKVGVDKARRDVFRAYTWVTFISNADFTLEGYEFVGRYDFERAVDGSPVCYLHTMPGAAVPAGFEETDGHCDHCNARRFRKNTFLVLNTETGAYEVFGRQCLKDIFTVSVSQIASLFELVRNPGSIAGGLDEEYAPGMKMTHYDRNETVIGWAVSVFNQSGFVSKKVAYDQDRQATADLVSFLMASPNYMSKEEQAHQAELKARYAATDADRADVETLTKLITEAAADGEYIEKLQKVFAQGHVSAQNFALLVSSVTLLKKHRATAVKAAELVDVPDVVEGRYELTGEIVSFREEPGFGFYDEAVMKVLIKDSKGRKYWGTYPRALGTPAQGDAVTLTATVSRGRDDSKFGIFKRPAKASATSQQTEAA